MRELAAGPERRLPGGVGLALFVDGHVDVVYAQLAETFEGYKVEGLAGMPARPPSARMVSSTLTSALAALMGRTATFRTSRILLAGTSLMWIVTPGRGPEVLAGFVVSVVPVSSGL
jgi:hypothetical protein